MAAAATGITATATPQAGNPATHPAARSLRRWMVVVGLLHLLLGVRLLPWVNGPMIEALGIETIYLGGDLATDDTAFLWVLDWMATFGLDVGVLGAVLLVAARNPVRNRLFAHLVIARELVAGVLDDIWFATREYVDAGVYVVFVAVHLVVVATGVRALRAAPRA